MVQPQRLRISSPADEERTFSEDEFANFEVPGWEDALTRVVLGFLDDVEGASVRAWGVEEIGICGRLGQVGRVWGREEGRSS